MTPSDIAEEVCSSTEKEIGFKVYQNVSIPDTAFASAVQSKAAALRQHFGEEVEIKSDRGVILVEGPEGKDLTIKMPFRVSDEELIEMIEEVL